MNLHSIDETRSSNFKMVMMTSNFKALKVGRDVRQFIVIDISEQSILNI